MSEEFNKRIQSLEGDVQRLKNIAWVLASVAVIFGLGGAYGSVVLNASKEKLATLESDVGDTERHFRLLRERAEEEFDSYVDEQLRIEIPVGISHGECDPNQGWSDWHSRVGTDHTLTFNLNCPSGQAMVNWQAGLHNDYRIKCCPLVLRKERP